MKDIEDKIESRVDVNLSEKQREREREREGAKWEIEHAVANIEACKSFLLKAFHQDQAWQDPLCFKH